ncbi:MAG: hypothetical protein A3K19_08605 [Lentisphaerae bacterium RIFOXYB12_FULL_65_16]|nr:MAG: hypothetical protein A3K18_05660 [Lentisphaerae bacterium RIFOXYA12_64_32]OGV89476.1 MAG: hypothetical protein A3K19_08605 [Lentisphaerae bacterium RIFOXYB12_FULL_65_16]
METDRDLTAVSTKLTQLKAELHRVFVGQDEVVEGILVAFFAGGHVLVEGVPGLGKTLLAKTLSRLISCKFNRIQFTPDLMPSDITGSHVFNMKTQEFDFYPGPVFTNIILADEINRAPAKTHSALLQVMEEHQVTIDAKTYTLEPPFFAIATQNPLETEGTYALPEAQIDRFMFKLLIPYPPEDHEEEILRLSISGTSAPERVLETLQPVVTSAEVMKLRQQFETVRVEPAVIRYANQIVRATRSWRDMYQGASPRAGITLLRGARVEAVLGGRDFVTPDDVRAICLPSLRHRVALTPESEVEGRDVDSVLNEVIESVEVPRQ